MVEQVEFKAEIEEAIAHRIPEALNRIAEELAELCRLLQAK